MAHILERWQRIPHSRMPYEAEYERSALAERIEGNEPNAAISILETYALTAPREGSYAGSLWALAEYVKTLHADRDRPGFHDLTIAPGADDLTFGSLLSELIRRAYQLVDGRAGPEARNYVECMFCRGNDADRPVGQRPSTALIKHSDNCSLAKHLPRLRAMANKGGT